MKNHATYTMRASRAWTAIIAAMLLFAMGAQAKDIYVSTSFHEPATEGLRFIYSYDGLRWDSIEGVFLRPEVGAQKVMRDPSIVQGPDGTFHLVWTSSWRGDIGFGYSSSKDLIHWTKQRFIPTGLAGGTTAIPGAGGTAALPVNTWAPELFYDDVKLQFLIVWASCIPGAFPDYQEDHLNNHRLYYMTTKDFKRFSEAKLFYDPGFSVIDATIVKVVGDASERHAIVGDASERHRVVGDASERHGKATSERANVGTATLGSVAHYVMVLKDNSRPMRNLKVAFADSPYGPWSEASEPFTESFTEGPSVARVGDWWYIYYDSYQHHIYGAHRTKDFKTFQDQTGAVSFPVGHKHGTVFMAPEELVNGLIHYNKDVVHYSPALRSASGSLANGLGRDAHAPVYALSERHDGGLKPVVGVHSIQTMRGGTVVGHASERANADDATPGGVTHYATPGGVTHYATLGGVAHYWTYNHQPMLAYWQGRYWLHYLTNPRHEHEAPGKTMLQTSSDGYTWTQPVELFPEYPVPEGWTKESRPDLPPAHNLKAVMHQRCGWYVASPPSGMSRWQRDKQGSVLLATGSYGICLTMKDDPNDGNGIGRVARRVFEDGTLGPIYFIYYNHGFSPRNTLFPHYKKSKDKAFVRAVDQMLADPMQLMQWVEEADRGDTLIPLTKPYKAFCGYTLPDGRKVALWKHAVTSLSADGGHTWRLTNVDGKLGCDRAPGFVNSNAKIWGQRLSDGTYATVYNPSEYRWPLAISLSADGLEYTTLSLINGEVTPLRHGGQYKSYGPQYVRGIEQPTPNPSPGEGSLNTSFAEDNLLGNQSPLPWGGVGGGSLWLTYSNNKEDIWVSRVPVPVRLDATTHAAGSFAQYQTLADMTDWNIYSPLWAPVTLDGQWLTLSDKDPYDYAKVERVIPNTKELQVEFDLRIVGNASERCKVGNASERCKVGNASERCKVGNASERCNDDAGTLGSVPHYGELDIEFVDDRGTVCSRIVIDSTAMFRVKGGARYGTLLKSYEADKTYHIAATLSCSLHRATFSVSVPDGSAVGKCTRQFDTPVESISRIVFRTDPLFKEPNTDTPADQLFDQPLADDSLPLARFSIANVASFRVGCGSIAAQAPVVLSYDSFSHYADRFNAMEDESIVTTIPNAQASEWMRENIPLFDCPDEQMREMYYYRWWTLRKHIKRTPVGYGMTEFLVDRSYADKYNLIACAIGHHVMESRWLRDTTYLHQILRTWYFGNDGQAMTKMNKFSSWNPYAILDMWKVEGDTAFLFSLKPRLEEEFARWEHTNRLPSGLYWQGDVQDGMEESISGGRKKQYARPTINSYMYGNAKALAYINNIYGDSAKTRLYEQKADTLRQLILDHLWNPDHQFFETLRGDVVGHASERASAADAVVGHASKRASVDDATLGGVTHYATPGGVAHYATLGGVTHYATLGGVTHYATLGGVAHYGDTLAAVREAIGYIPWYFNLPDVHSKYDVAWQQILDEQGFSAPYGLTTAERRHPEFRSHGVGKCEWDGAIWPFATSQTLTALANYLQPTPTPAPREGSLNTSFAEDNLQGNQSPLPWGGVGGGLFFRQMQLYTESQHHRGRPYIGEYLDEKTGAWLMGDRERSRYYNHSTYNDLIITGICGLRPQADGSIAVNPLIPKNAWPYFCLDGIRYRGHTLTIIWDQDGQRYHQGRGLTLLVDGRPVANRKEIGIIRIERNLNN